MKLDKNEELYTYTPYEKYCEYMLIAILHIREIEEIKKWGSYLIQKNSKAFSKPIIVNDGAGGENAKLFYDLLIEYVKSGKYK